MGGGAPEDVTLRDHFALRLDVPPDTFPRLWV
jgi:hypothetical protein